jgi:hypothetical protein
MWIIQSNFLDVNQITPLVEALNEFGIPFEDVSVIPFSDEFVSPLTIDHTRVIPYGSTKLCKIAEQRKWQGLFFDRQAFRVDTWNKHRTDMLNQTPDIMTVERAMEDFQYVHPDSMWFIRPVEDLKAFNGTLTNAKEIKHWLSSVDSGNFNFDKNTLVAISNPQEIKMEWRYFIVDRKVITGSVYKRQGLRLVSREENPNVLAEAQRLADGWLPHETCAMDVALTDKGLYIVEFNCLNSSGFYYHDIRQFATAVNAYFERKY